MSNSGAASTPIVANRTGSGTTGVVNSWSEAPHELLCGVIHQLEGARRFIDVEEMWIEAQIAYLKRPHRRFTSPRPKMP
jgi:hypothetical protein